MDKEKETITVECFMCGSEIVISLVNGCLPGCVRCPICGQKTCGD